MRKNPYRPIEALAWVLGLVGMVLIALGFRDRKQK